MQYTANATIQGVRESTPHVFNTSQDAWGFLAGVARRFQGDSALDEIKTMESFMHAHGTYTGTISEGIVRYTVEEFNP